MSFLEVRDITLNFGGVMALQDVNTTIDAGEIRGIIGPNGAGKSTLINVISRFYNRTSGSNWPKVSGQVNVGGSPAPS